MGETTTIQIERETKEKLDTLKIIERETYDDVIKRLLKCFKKEA